MVKENTEQLEATAQGINFLNKLAKDFEDSVPVMAFFYISSKAGSVLIYPGERDQVKPENVEEWKNHLRNLALNFPICAEKIEKKLVAEKTEDIPHPEFSEFSNAQNYYGDYKKLIDTAKKAVLDGAKVLGEHGIGIKVKLMGKKGFQLFFDYPKPKKEKKHADKPTNPV